MTCKHATQRDQIWLSPEAIQCLKHVSVFDYFADHSIAAVQLHLPTIAPVLPTWPRPARLPWASTDTENWNPNCALDYGTIQDPTQFFHDISMTFEKEVNRHHRAQHDLDLPHAMKGRAQRLQPRMTPQCTPCTKPSREGEVKLVSALTGSATKLWFKQLRRIQSLKHAVVANRNSPSSLANRAELWSAILRSSGFCPSFPTWWRQRTPIIEGSPLELPQGPPAEGADAILLYEEFLHHFCAFEKWHNSQRTRSLKAKFEGSLQALYQDLRPAPRNCIDHLWKEQSYTILAVDSDTGQIQVDKPISTDFDFVWLHESHYVNISGITNDFCSISSSVDVFPGDELIQRIFVSDTKDVLELFAQYWQPRWNQLQQISPTDWDRIVAFAGAYMPKHTLEVAPLELDSWRRIVKQFKPRAARGPDGYDKDDLMRMPASYVQAILTMLTAIEDSGSPWPQQLLLGLVIGLAKHDQAHEEGHYRPINLFSMWYRAWARLRTKEMIRQLAALMPPEALGFLPARETTEVWMVLQSHIEVMLQMDQEYCGMSTDLQKAFNCIGRDQVFLIANHVGITDKLCRPWKKFLTTFARRFEVGTAIGAQVLSSSGYPEGCPLSIVAMLCVNWTYHVYMTAFAPRVTSYSFVDNLTLASMYPGMIARAFFALKTLCALFGLSTDDTKTYVWGTTSSSRRLLAQLGFPCLQDASELGGAMTYGAAIRNRALKQRGQSLGDKWNRLRRSAAPQLQKYTILPKVFWPKALHGSVNCLVADGYAQDLRRQAVKSIRANGAGSNPLLRLSLSDDMANDPGFYQLQLCLRTFQRMLRKSSDLLILWRIRMTGFTGKLLPGPFSRLIQCLSLVGWSVLEPPFILDHEQRRWNLMDIDGKSLRAVLEDAWLQYMSSCVRRQTMHDFQGCDGYLTLLDSSRLPSLQRALLSALHCGAFMTSLEHSKYDPEQPPFCSHCGCEDDRAHWLQCPRFEHLRTQIPGWHLELETLPRCTLHHLLVPRSSTAVAWRSELWQLEDRTTLFCFEPPPKMVNHLFMDGLHTT